jgi:AraC family transcriptional regulator, arabinose operon regulatory protein
MSLTSNWPLPKSSVRFLVPRPYVKQLALSSLSRGLVPLAFGYYEAASGHAIKRENHDNHLVILCVGGRGHVTIEGQTFIIEKNDMVFLPKGIAHQYKADAKTPWTIYWSHIDGHLFTEFMDVIGVNIPSVVVPLSEPDSIIHEFQQLIHSRQYGYHLNRFFVASNILKKLFSLVTLQRPIITGNNQVDLTPYSIELYFEENITKTLTLDEMAQYFGFSKFYFAKKFQLLTGTSPLKLFLQKKIQTACGYLDSTDKPIKTISKLLGYDDAYYFSRLFKQTIGISPSQYRSSRHSH